MVDISGDFHHITKSPSINRNKNYAPNYYAEPVVSCEECPASKVCKKIGNYRKSCEPGQTPNYNDISSAKCLSGSIILLAKLLEKSK